MKILLTMREELAAQRVIEIPNGLTEEQRKAYIDKAMDIFCEDVDNRVDNIGDGYNFVVSGHDYADGWQMVNEMDERCFAERIAYGDTELLWRGEC